jgi:hypothetical protein
MAETTLNRIQPSLEDLDVRAKGTDLENPSDQPLEIRGSVARITVLTVSFKIRR